MTSLPFFESVAAFFRPASPGVSYSSPASTSSHPEGGAHPAVRQPQPKQEAIKPMLRCRRYVDLSARAQRSDESSTNTTITTTATDETATTTKDSSELSTSDKSASPRGMSSALPTAKAVSTTDHGWTLELLASKANSKQSPSVPNQEPTGEISSAISWRGRLHHKSSRRFAAVKNALLHRRPRPSAPNNTQESAHEQRKISGESNASMTTVYRRPSRREDSPIATESRNRVDEPIPQRTSTEKIRIPKGRPLPEYSFRDFSSVTQESGCSDYTPPALDALPSYMLHQRLFSNMSVQNRQDKAFRDFNQLAEFHHFYMLVPPEHDPINLQEVVQPKTSKTRAILHKVRSMRSGIRLRGSQQTPALRRVKTFTGLSGQFYSMDSLKGKHLEFLARLGGYSVLTFPGDFVPALMRLPACIVSMIDYLRLHGAKSRNVFFDPGDITIASRIYDHFASQVLSAEKEQCVVDVTMRKSNFPCEAVGFGSEEESFLRGRFHVLPVAWAFKQVLKGIPGGVLGSPRLYLTLVELSTRIFPDEPPDLPEGQLYWARPAVSQTRVRAIALSILALTSDMQLDLICAVFGLCSLLDYETSRLIEEYQARGVSTGSFAGLLTRQRIVQTFAPLLAGEMFEVEEQDYDNNAFFVMNVMMTNWRAVSRQLRAFDG